MNRCRLFSRLLEISPYFYGHKIAQFYVIQFLKGKKGIIFGALDEKSLAWRTALRCHEEGAQLVLTNAPVALRMGEINKLAEAVNAPVIGADVTNMDDLKKLFEESMKHFGGGIDFILHSVGMSVNMRKGKLIQNLIMDSIKKQWIFLHCLCTACCAQL